MNIAVVVYDKINLASLAQIWQFLNTFESRRSVKICALKSEIIDEYGLKFTPQVQGESLYGYDAIIVPDGIGALSLRYDEIFLSWIKSASRAKIKIGLNLGALILGGAGFLENKIACVRAGYKNALKEYCEFIEEKIYRYEDVVTISKFDFDSEKTLEEILL